MLHICTIRAGTAFAPAYVNILFDSVRRNLADGFGGEFVCFTDQPDKLAEGISSRPLPVNLPGWWSKLALHRPGLFSDGDRVLFLDLDTLITGRLDEIAAYAGPFAILRDFYRADGLQSAVMAWEAGKTTEIWRTYEAAGLPQDEPGGDQAWVERVLDPPWLIPGYGTFYGERPVRLQDTFPGLFVSYKQIDGPPDKASVVCFHGKPRPHEVTTGWVPEVWKVGGMTRAELDSVCNTAKETLAEHLRGACARDLPWLDLAPEHDGHVCIVGGGPSLADTLEELKWRASIGQKVWALNGAARFLYRNGICPDALVIADARAENVEFLAELNAGVAIYLASQCHPELFEAAREYGLPVTLWHANSDGVAEALANEKARPVHLIGGGSTVGLHAMVLASAVGYRKIHLYGFDSSYRTDQHHAYPQNMNDGDRIVDAIFRDEKFKVAPWMAQQVNEFKELVPGLASDGCVITVAGDGLLPTVARAMADNMPVTPAQVRALEVLKRLNGADQPRGAEVGVFKGDMSAAMLRYNPLLHLDMIDSWEGGGGSYRGDSGDWHSELTQNAQDEFQRKALERTAFASDRRMVVRERSVRAAQNLNVPYDFVFLDADHSYEGCRADIAAWAPKVKPGGWLGGHDYENKAFPKFGVTRAVNEYACATGLSVELGENFCWFIKMPCYVG